MKVVRNLLFILITISLASCAGKDGDRKSSDGKQAEKKTSQQQTTASKPGQGPAKQGSQAKDAKMSTDAKPGFGDSFARGQKRRESIEDKFDDKGNLIERRDKVFDKNGNVMKKNRYTYKYDDRGLRIEQWYYATTVNDEPIMSNVNYIKYDDRGYKIENVFIAYDENQQEVRWAKNIFKNDAEGRTVEDANYNKQGIIQSKVVYNYEKGMLVSENFFEYDSRGKQTHKKTLFYNETGTVIGEKDE